MASVNEVTYGVRLGVRRCTGVILWLSLQLYHLLIWWIVYDSLIVNALLLS